MSNNKSKSHSTNTKHIFPGASILPYTTLPDSDFPYFILGEEINQAKKGTWDAWGGGRDPGEIDPIQTAVREYDEESMKLLGELSTEKYILKDIEVNYPDSIILENNNKGRTYITYFPPAAFQVFARSFYSKRKELIERYDLEKQKKSGVDPDKIKQLEVCIEKSRLGIASRNHLIEIIRNTNKTAKGWPLEKAYANILIIDSPDGQTLTPHTVELRPLIIYTLSQYADSLFQDENA